MKGCCDILSAFKNFGVTFLIAIVIFGIIAYFATGFVTGTVTDILSNEHDKLDEIIGSSDNQPDETDDSENIQDNNPEKEIYGDSFNFLVVTTDYRPDAYNTYLPTSEKIAADHFEANKPADLFGYLSGSYRKTNVTSIVIVRIDKEKEQVIYSYITPLMRVFTSSGYRTLSEVYNFYGIDKVADYVNSMTGLEFKYSFLLNGYNMDELINTAGAVSVSVGKDIYNDGLYNTFSYQSAVETEDRYGNKFTEYVTNKYIMSMGYIKLDAESLYNASSVIEHSASDLITKQALAVELTRSYLSYLASLDEDHLMSVLAHMMITEDLWESIPDILENIQPPIPEETFVGTPDLPFDTTPAETEVVTDPVETEPEPETEPAETDIPEETEEPEEDPEETEDNGLFEPVNPIIETNFNINEFYEIYELFLAVNKFENKIITYPCTYVPANEESDEYFEYDVAHGVAMFVDYRLISDK